MRKPMFLALRVTKYIVNLPHAVVLGCRNRSVGQSRDASGSSPAKRRLVEKNLQGNPVFVEE